MELWIRSQDRERLKKIDKIGIFEGEDGWYIGEDIIRDYGKYKTKERALEVLDEIHKILIDYKKMDRVVYSMPKE